MKRVHHIFVTGVIAALLVGQARASTPAQHYFLQTGADLEQVCANPVDAHNIQPAERERLLVCGSYIQGYLSHYALVRGELAKAPFCLPQTGVSGEQIRVLLVTLLQRKPQIRDLPASVDLATSIAWAYGCPGAANTSGKGATPSPAAP